MPIPIGAMYVALCLTAASMTTVKTNKIVVNISMKQPCAMDVPPPSFRSTVIGPGKVADATPAAAMEAMICAMTM